MRQREKIQELPREKYVIRFEKVESRLADVFVQSTFVCKKKKKEGILMEIADIRNQLTQMNEKIISFRGSL